MGMITAPESVTILAQRVQDQLQAGASTVRVSADTRAIAFGWTDGLPPTLANFVATDQVNGLRFDYVQVAPTATPATKVGEGLAKPNAVAFTPQVGNLAKYAGYAEYSLEADLSTVALAAVIYQTLAAQSLMALEVDMVAALAAVVGGVIATGDSWAAALLDAQAKLLANGSRPGVFVVSAEDYGDLMTENAGAGGFAMVPDVEAGPLGRRLFGSVVHVSPKLAKGTAYVIDPAAVLVVEHTASPVVIVDTVSQARNNKITLVVDLVAGVAVVGPLGVASVTVTPAP